MSRYLKGSHLTLDSWRSNRDKEGWKVEDEAWMKIIHHQILKGQILEDQFHDMLISNDSLLGMEK